ncbi:MAG TPA: hypothetical protein VGH16_23355 [Candidatus Binatia bacterium]|jgi:hypothetical protein
MQDPTSNMTLRPLSKKLADYCGEDHADDADRPDPSQVLKKYLVIAVVLQILPGLFPDDSITEQRAINKDRETYCEIDRIAGCHQFLRATVYTTAPTELLSRPSLVQFLGH